MTNKRPFKKVKLITFKLDEKTCLRMNAREKTI